MIELGVNSYCTVEFAIEYADTYDIDLPTEGDGGSPEAWPELEKLLIQATKFIDRRWGSLLADYDADEIPAELQEATVEMASLIYDDYDVREQSSGAVVQSTESIGSLSASYTYKSSGHQDLGDLSYIQMILSPIFVEGTGGLTQSRGA